MAVREAINSAIDEEMARDEKVFIIGKFCCICQHHAIDDISYHFISFNY
jgi:hypothetical protein